MLAAVGAIASGVIGMAQASYQGQVAKMNASIAKDNAKRVMQRSQVQEQDQGNLTAAMLGTQEAAQSASGLDLNSTTSRRIRKASAILGRKDVLNVRQDAEIEKYNYLTQAANFEGDAKSSQIGGIGSLLSGFINAGGSLVGQSTSSGYSFTAKPVRKPVLV
jgi:hypothetical protein